MRSNFIKILDNINTGLITLNKVIHADRNFSGVNFNSFIRDKNLSKRKLSKKNKFIIFS